MRSGSPVRRFTLWLLLVAAAGLAGRLAYVASVSNDFGGLYDSIWYSTEAELLVEGDWFRAPVDGGPDGHTAGHAPLTAVVLAPAALIGDDSVFPMRLAMAGLGAASIVVIGLLARALAGDRAGLAAAVVAAAYPFLWMSDGLVMSETPTVLLVAGTLLAAYRVLARPSWGRFVVLGVLCGLAALTRAELVLFLPLLALPLALRSAGTWRDRILRAGVAIGLAVLVLAPWLAYNQARFDEPTFISTQDGVTLLGGSCDETFSGPNIGLIGGPPECGLAGLPTGDESVQSKVAREQALDYLGDHRDRVPLVAAVRVLRTWNLYRPGDMIEFNTYEGRPRWATTAGLWFFYPLVALAVVGAVRLRRLRRPLWPLAVPIVITVVVSAVFWGQTRFRAPAEPVLVVLAGIAIAWLVALVTGGTDAASPGETGPSGTDDTDDTDDADVDDGETRADETVPAAAG
jgi:4-amino-4-deoxy-L-arabinose transferase-like glycosyltransferase